MKGESDRDETKGHHLALYNDERASMLLLYILLLYILLLYILVTKNNKFHIEIAY